MSVDRKSSQFPNRIRAALSVALSLSLLPFFAPSSVQASASLAVSSACDTGYGVYGTITANGAPVAGASVRVATVAFTYSEMVGEAIGQFVGFSGRIDTAADGTFESCDIDTSDVDPDASIYLMLAATPPSDLYGREAGQFGVTTLRRELGPASSQLGTSHDVSVELASATANAHIVDVNGDPIDAPSAELSLRTANSEFQFPVPVKADGWVGLASVTPEEVSELPGEDFCWGCSSYASLRVTVPGFIPEVAEVTFIDAPPYAVWTNNVYPYYSPEPVAEDQWNEFTFELTPANLTINVQAAGSGDPVAFAHLNAYPMGPCNSQNCYAWGYTDESGVMSTALSADGQWVLAIQPPSDSGFSSMSYYATVSEGEVVEIADSEDNLICSNDDADVSPCDGTLTVTLRPPNFAAIVRGEDGSPVPFVGVDASIWQTVIGSSWYGVGWASSAGFDEMWGGDPDAVEGSVQFSLRTGKYKLNLNPPWTGSQDVAQTSIYLNVTTGSDGEITSIEVCETGSDPWSAADCDTNPTQLPTSVVDGVTYYDLTMRAPNLRLTVCSSTPGSCVPALAHAQLQRYQADEYGPGGWWNYVGYGQSDESGSLNLLVDEAGDYRLSLEDNMYNPDGTREARTTIEFTATDVNGDLVFTGLGEADPDTGRFEVRYAQPTLRGRVVSPNDGAAQRWSSIEIFAPSNDEYCATCRQHVGWVQTNDSGEFALVLDAGNYFLRLNPSWEAEQAGDLAKTEIDITLSDCDADEVLEAYLSSDDCGTPLAGDDGVVVFTLAGVNFSGTLYIDRDSQEPVNWSQGNVKTQIVDEWSGQTRWEWTDNWFYIREGGGFGVALLETGRYRLEFQPPHSSDALVVKAVIDVDVDCTAECTVTPLTTLDADENGYVVYLGQPNVTGTLTLPDTGNPVADTWINVEKWSTGHCWDGCYSWDPSLDGVNANTRQNGQWGMQLASGSYRLTFNPIDGYARSQLKVLVDQSGTVCTQPMDADGYPQTDATCTASETPFAAQLLAPNVTGTVAGGETRSRWSGIQFQVWNPDNEFWDWTNIWANTNDRGAFAVRLETAGLYKLTFEPEWNLTEFSAATRYVVVCESGSNARVALAASQAEGTAWDCPTAYDTMATDVSDAVALVGANLSGRAEDQSGNGIGDVWIGLLDCGSDDGSADNSCSWQRGVNSRRIWGDPTNDNSGRFGLTVLDTDTDDAFATHYELEVNPPWDNTQGFVRQRIDIYAYSGWGTGSSFCHGDGYDNSGDVPTCAGGYLYDGESRFTLLMSTGNITGRVITAEAACDAASPTADNCPGVTNSWVEVQRWSTPEWDESAEWYHWQWEDANTNTVQGHNDPDKAGNFGLNLTTDGLYRITANPSWENTGGYARRTVLIRVAGDNWCLEPGQGNNFDSQDVEPIEDPCIPGANDNAADSIDGLTMRLVGSNLLGRLYRPATDTSDADAIDEVGNKVGDVWVGLEKSETYQWCSDVDDDGNLQPYCTSTWWNWQGGSSVPGGGSSKGNFALSISEPGSYRLRVDAPWNWDVSSGDQLTSFNETFTVAGDGCVDGNDDPSLCTITFDDSNIVRDGVRHLLTYPTPNVVGTLYSPNAAADGSRVKVGGSWISISNETTGEWFNGVSTVRSGTRKGQFSLLLEPPEAGEEIYRLEFWPNWERPDDGTRKVVRVTVSHDGTITSDGFDEGTQDVTLSGVTLRGSVYYEVDGEETPMRYAWAEAERCIGSDPDPCLEREWTDSRGTERDGSIQLGLEDGTYWIRVHPNWGLLATRPMELKVTIQNDVMTSCEYDDGGSCMRTDESGDVYFEPNFHHQPPNVRVVVSGATVTNDRYVVVRECSGSDCSAPSEVGTYLARYESVSGAATLDLTLDFSVNDYTVKVLVRDGESLVNPEVITDPDDNLTDATVTFTLTAAP